MHGRCGKGPPWLCGKFMDSGYRMTKPREVIFEALGRISGHPSAEEVHFEVHKHHPDVGLTSVYRTLELLVEMNLIQKFDFGDGRARYELLSGSQNDNHHHHLVCTNCKRIINYDDFIDDELELLKKTEKGLSEKFNFKITDHLIQFYGLCDKCK
jgi:Fur family ferric uptake transcriptional regulator